MDEQQTVSFDDEPLILVDGDDNIIDHTTKLSAHQGDGQRHRAFSIFLFAQDQVLLQQRSATKPLWPLFWSNSCCSHPRKGESYETAIHRRLREELALDLPLHFLYRFEYHARYRDVGAEHELCSVYVGKLPAPQTVAVNPLEVAAWQWLDCTELDARVAANAPELTPWFVLEWTRLRRDFNDAIVALPATPPL